MDTNFQPNISTNALGHYRQHPLEFKRALVALSLEPGVARVAREHSINANQVFSCAGFISRVASARLR
jgi:transposase